MSREDKDSMYEPDEFRNSAPILKRVIAIIIIAFLIAVTFQALIPTTGAADVIRVLRYGAAEPLDTANPFLGLLDISYIFYGLIYDCMIFPGKDLIQTPNIAESWWKMDGPTAASLPNPTDFSDSEDFGDNTSAADWPYGSIWEYNISDDIFFNDGTPCTAKDVAWTMNIQTGDNFAIYWAFQPTTTWIHHAEAVTDNKVRIFFADMTTGGTGWPFSVAFADYMSIWIMPKHIFGDKPSTEMAFVWDGLPTIGTGPFMGGPNIESEMVAKESLTLVKNPYYDFIDPVDGERKGLGGKYNRTIEVDKLILKFFAERNTLHLGVETGQVDCAIIEPGTYLQWKSEKENGTLTEDLEIVSIYPCTGFTKAFAFNAYKSAPGTVSILVRDPAVLRAANLATDRNLILQSVFKGLGETGRTIIATPAWPDWYWDPETEPSYFSVLDGSGDELLNVSRPLNEAMEYDVDLANQILDAAGYIWEGEEGNSRRKATALVGERLTYLGIVDNPSAVPVNTPLEFEHMLPVSDAEDKLIANIVTNAWKDVGIYSEINIAEDAKHWEEVYSYRYEIEYTYWSGDVDPNYLCYITTEMALWGWNDFGIMEDEYDELFFKQAQAFTYDERKYWVDECSKWQYLYGSMIVHTYPQVQYAYRTDTWTNWGNWTQYPGLGIDHFWGEPPIYYEIKYVGSDIDDDGDGGSVLPYAIAGVVIAAIAAIAAFTMMQRKKKLAEIMREDEFETEEDEDKSMNP